jgi:hypothetical protein
VWGSRTVSRTGCLCCSHGACLGAAACHVMRHPRMWDMSRLVSHLPRRTVHHHHHHRRTVGVQSTAQHTAAAATSQGCCQCDCNALVQAMHAEAAATRLRLRACKYTFTCGIAPPSVVLGAVQVSSTLLNAALTKLSRPLQVERLGYCVFVAWWSMSAHH